MATLVDVGGVVQHYVRKYRARSMAELDSFRAETTLEAAIRRAALASKPDGRRYSHQRRLKPEDLAKAADKLVGHQARIEAAQNFAVLLEAVTSAVGHLAGLGELYLYDTALRIGAKRGVLPTRVYVHAGTREGAKALGIEVKGRKTIDRFELPPAMRELDSHEIEDVLCIYKGHFTGELVDLEENESCWPDDESDDESA